MAAPTYHIWQAGAVGVIMTNNRDDGLVNMGAVSGDASEDITIPSVFVTQVQLP